MLTRDRRTKATTLTGVARSLAVKIGAGLIAIILALAAVAGVAALHGSSIAPITGATSGGSDRDATAGSACTT